ncbi:MAG: hypothetical protein H0W33_11755, partial [Gammaproteobacteria bacterium]|nr:hypothetical protein [Gammaproteobacteria bacterium]
MNLPRRAASLLPDVKRTRTGPIGLHMAREAIHLVQLECTPPPLRASGHGLPYRCQAAVKKSCNPQSGSG